MPPLNGFFPEPSDSRSSCRTARSIASTWGIELIQPTNPEVVLPLAQSIVLPDGRRLAYDDVGDASGTPVLFLHGVPGSRRYWTIATTAELLARRGIRLLSIDRPGMGLSSPHPRRSVPSFAEDVRSLAESLELSRVGVIGFSGGAPYALAIAAFHPELVTNVALVAPMADLGVPRLLDGLDPYVRRALKLAAKSHVLLQHRLVERLDAPHLVTLGAERAWSHLPASDRRVLSQPSVRAAAKDTMQEAARRGFEGLRLDAEILLRPWEFDLAGVGAPVEIFCGGADPWSTDEIVHWLKRGLGNVRIRRSPAAGHFCSLANEFDSVLGVFSAEPTAQPVAEPLQATTA